MPEFAEAVSRETSLARQEVLTNQIFIGLSLGSLRLWRWAVSLLAWAALICAVLATPATAQDRRQNAVGEFDFYVLSLSWSPSFCEAAQERGQTGRNQQIQCAGRPYAFVVHGLWPQYERGFPEYCQNPPPFVDGRIVNSMLDLMPARGLIISEWKKHGACSGLQPRGYFDTIRKARATVKIPDDFLDLSSAKTVSPEAIEQAFIKANPGLEEKGFAVLCDSKRLSEVRICMSKDLKFRSCDEIDRRACRRDTVVMPPVRGG